MLGLPRAQAPDRIVAGAWTKAIVGRIAGVLFDEDFITKLDGDGCRHLVAFSCGTVYDTTLHLARE